jgi:hypothetical protein
MAQQDEWISVQEAQAILRLSTRSTQRYAQTKRIRSRRVGTRLQLHQADVLALADELGSVNRRPAPAQSVPADVLLGYVEKLRVETNTLNTQIGMLQEQLNHRPQLQDMTNLQAERDAATAQRDELARRVVELETRLQQLAEPWYKRLFRR